MVMGEGGGDTAGENVNMASQVFSQNSTSLQKRPRPRLPVLPGPPDAHRPAASICLKEKMLSGCNVTHGQVM
ncbi:hypothetical protein JOB18_033671 [Solea senegalensis]|uniref:Uncharacterized protein n=1 Tax=Solea senegalensis TaxID=28829 RepID=A0AAV6PWT0_SOLSE|nr:hypothetical protein JOB18_033671 [Solea senegalensis]